MQGWPENQGCCLVLSAWGYRTQRNSLWDASLGGTGVGDLTSHEGPGRVRGPHWLLLSAMFSAEARGLSSGF